MNTFVIFCFSFSSETNIWPIKETVTSLSQSSSFSCFSLAISPKTQLSNSILHLRYFKWNSFLLKKFCVTFNFGFSAVSRFSLMCSKPCTISSRMKDILSHYFLSICTQKSYPPWLFSIAPNQILWKTNFSKEFSHFANNYTKEFIKFLTKGLLTILSKT